MRNDSCNADNSTQPQTRADVMDNGGRPRVRNQRAADVHGPSILMGTLPTTELYYRQMAYPANMVQLAEDQQYLSRDYAIEENETVVVKTEPGLEVSNKENHDVPQLEIVNKVNCKSDNNNTKNVKSISVRRLLEKSKMPSWHKINTNGPQRNLSKTRKILPIKLSKRKTNRRKMLHPKRRVPKTIRLSCIKRKVHLKSIKCSRCRKTYISAYHCQVHKAREHSIRTQRHACTNCDRLFVSKATALYHRKYICK